MPFNHNDHYHRLLLRQLPRSCSTALDVGCGTGRFARRLARLGVEVRAVDPSEEAIAAACTLSEGMPSGMVPRFEHGDVTELELPYGHYDFISCLASIHHMPFDTVTSLRDALAPGGVLVILGCYPEKTWVDWAWSLAAVPANAVARVTIAVMDRTRPASAGSGRDLAKAPVRPPTVPLLQIRQQADLLLPGFTLRRLLFWRYLLVFRNTAVGSTDY
ncbi:class I SAM-dependent methyltransferase [Kitasatospora kifunensis]|uniref:2-polyprenyl-3-methyl-5-hydroxy-6-metoxy-1, 4-benzoquinol methylase n=1 Tax=Kitasatospora kifunensis TaxID=58351 RepID=A0A7W7RBP2_KITKI|nr:class I SAM-dependent methyltransferase [Kitasatospora kifunensis]MBB4928974.1 2-polyprenyl-3-methyl-5-hydroxy-6-metoxy-1,4-benzoquinol methylase [Kitasatospora kifunensis]